MAAQPEIDIREGTPDDIVPLEIVYADAFPYEGLMPLVVVLLEPRFAVVSLVASVDARSSGTC
ncbi:MAG TPA: hypothetical protein GX405_10510 [Rhizobiales bacterium]|nr:hypothetical protein [Hyphomicrobiales bacterium]